MASAKVAASKPRGHPRYRLLASGVARHQHGVDSVQRLAAPGLIVLVWLYYSAQILLLGAEFAKAYSDRRRALDEARQTAQAVA